MRAPSKEKSRAKARMLVKTIHPEIHSTLHVHHIDGNPFNNDLKNLCILPRGFHSSLHNKGLKRTRAKKGTCSKRCKIFKQCPFASKGKCELQNAWDQTRQERKNQ